MTGARASTVERAIADAHRREWAYVLAATVRVPRDLDLAEECVQEAYVSALDTWTRGHPHAERLVAPERVERPPLGGGGEPGAGVPRQPLSVRYSERMIMRFGAEATLLPGLGLIAAGLALFTQAPVDGDYVTNVLPTMLLIGTGAGLAFPALMTLAMSGATQSDAGLASGLVNTTTQVGGALGLAVLATLSTSRSNGLITDGETRAAAPTSGYHFAFWIGAGLVVAAIAVAVTMLRPEREPAADGAPALAEAC